MTATEVKIYLQRIYIECNREYNEQGRRGGIMTELCPTDNNNNNT